MTDKAACRRAGLAAREALRDGPEKSRQISDRLLARPEFRQAGVVSSYVGVGTEVSTGPFIHEALRRGKEVVVPRVHQGDLTLHRIAGLEELAPAGFGLLEPVPAVLAAPDRRRPPETVDLFVVPGLAFDPAGGRVGYGKGYYDRLLARARPGTPLIALAFRCQIFPEVPVGPDDVRMTVILTESDVYERTVD